MSGSTGRREAATINLALAAFLDWAVTQVALADGLVELNPLMRSVVAQPVWALLVRMGAAGVVAWIGWRLDAAWLIWTVAVLWFLVVGWNTLQVW